MFWVDFKCLLAKGQKWEGCQGEVEDWRGTLQGDQGWEEALRGRHPQGQRREEEGQVHLHQRRRG